MTETIQYIYISSLTHEFENHKTRQNTSWRTNSHYKAFFQRSWEKSSRSLNSEPTNPKCCTPSPWLSSPSSPTSASWSSFSWLHSFLTRPLSSIWLDRVIWSSLRTAVSARTPSELSQNSQTHLILQWLKLSSETISHWKIPSPTLQALFKRTQAHTPHSFYVRPHHFFIPSIPSVFHSILAIFPKSRSVSLMCVWAAGSCCPMLSLSVLFSQKHTCHSMSLFWISELLCLINLSHICECVFIRPWNLKNSGKKPCKQKKKTEKKWFPMFSGSSATTVKKSLIFKISRCWDEVSNENQLWETGWDGRNRELHVRGENRSDRNRKTLKWEKGVGEDRTRINWVNKLK